jgi:hypothetical protein
MTLEKDEQKELSMWLDHQQLIWLHIPNEGLKSISYNVMMKALGLKSGAPDVLIFNSPPNKPFKKGVAIELKRSNGGTLSADQKKWMTNLKYLGWETQCCHGAKRAIDYLYSLGYKSRPIMEVTKL